MTNHNLPDSPDAGNRYSDEKIKQMLLDRAKIMALRQLPDSLSMHIDDPGLINNLRRGIVLNQKMPRRIGNDSSYTQQVLDRNSWLLANLAQQGTGFFDNPETPGSLATQFECIVDTVIEQSNPDKAACFSSFILQLKEQLKFIKDPINKKIGIGFFLTIGTEAYARYYFAYTDDAHSLLSIIAERGTDYDAFKTEEYRELVKAYLIISSLVDVSDPYEHRIDQAQ